jgi:hypothetical protein
MMIWGIPKSKGGSMSRKAFRLMLCILFLIAILVGCAKPTQMVTPSPPTPTPMPLPTFTSQPKSAIDIQPTIDMLVQYDQKMTEWSSLMGTTHAFETGDPTYQEYLYNMFSAPMNPGMIPQDARLQMISNNQIEVKQITELGDSIISLSNDIEAGILWMTAPQELTAPRKQIGDCINANSEYFQLVDNFLNHGYIPTMDDYHQLWIPFPCLNYQDSISLLKQFVQDNQ